MRYPLRDSIVIRSENAAKPHHQSSGRTTRAIRSLGFGGRILDFGCGKLRYAKVLASLGCSVTFVDSAIQLDRLQQVFGRRTTVRTAITSRWDHCRAVDLDTFLQDRACFDFVLCANVLSAIPSFSHRVRVARILAAKMLPNALCLVVVQHRNGDFRAAPLRACASAYIDGYLLHGRRGPSFYAPLKRDYLERLLKRNGHTVLVSFIDGESTFVLSTRQ